MNYIADLHIHSLFSRATSKASNLAGLFAWARVKGIQVIGTGDFTHPGWFSQLKEKLVPAEPGFFRLKDENVGPALDQVTPEERPMRFVLTSEISNIYKRHDKVRKVHNLLFAPDFASVERINSTLAGIGNIESDGRPILGLDSRNLLEILLENCPDGFLVPAHIWTPWFSLFGSRSGFDRIEDCYGDLTSHIFALETGLSSDPDMNRLISALDKYTLISNSDCHSPGKLGREANLFDTDFDFFAMREAMKNPAKGFKATIEFYPEEGKYHLDGHRKCQVCLEPMETRRINAICPVCGRPLTVGVSHRVYDLADREKPFYPPGSPGVHSLIPLAEVLGEIAGYGPGSKTVMKEYCRVISRFGSEFTLLLKTPIEEINAFSTVLGEAIKRIRANKVIKKPGFDGEFGVIHVFEEGEIDALAGQLSLFGGKRPKKRKNRTKKNIAPLFFSAETIQIPQNKTTKINPEQQTAIDSQAGRILVSAGPGTGKTFTLVARLAHLLKQKKSPKNISVITFTNRAADEVRERIIRECGKDGEKVFIGTFHNFCLSWLRKKEADLTVLDDESRDLVLRYLFPSTAGKELIQLKKAIETHLGTLQIATNDLAEMDSRLRDYFAELKQRKVIDLEAVIPFFVRLLMTDTEFADRVKKSVHFLFIDEFQDLNQAQYDLVEILAKSAQVFAIGDPDQAIYGFRGSDLKFFFQFSENKATQCLTLNRNYRSAPVILQAASELIRHNTIHSDVRLLPQLSLPGQLSFYQARSPKAEAEFIVKTIEETMGGISSFSINSGRGGEGSSETGFNDFAVLYRLSRQARPLAEALERRGIPFQLVGATPFFMKKEIRTFYHWLQIVVQKAEPVDFINLLKEMPGIGPATISKIESHSTLAGTDFFRGLDQLGLPAKARTSIKEMKDQFARINSKVSGDGLISILKNAMSFLHVKQDCPHAKRLLELAMVFRSLKDFAAHLKQNRTATIYDDRAEAVTLMTLHGAKGLEFPSVFITGLEEGVTPYLAFERTDIEEERRLFYVGMTRAMERLILSYSVGRGGGPSARQPISRFIKEIPAEDLQIICQKRKKKSAATQLSLF